MRISTDGAPHDDQNQTTGSLFDFDLSKKTRTSRKATLTSLLALDERERSSMGGVVDVIVSEDGQTTPALPRAQWEAPGLVILVWVPESVLTDVLAKHTLEMIPRSMTLKK